MALHILVVDDQPMILHIHTQMLRDLGHTVETASDGQGGLELFRQRAESKPFDMILTDEMMPQMSGMEMCEAIFTEFGAVPTLMISAIEDLELMMKLMRLGITFLRKPIKKPQLQSYLDKIEKQIELNRQREDYQANTEKWCAVVQSQSIQLQIGNDPDEQEQLIKLIINFCQQNGICEDVLFRLHFGLEETLSNATAHGNLEMNSAEYKQGVSFQDWDDEIARRLQMAPYKDRQVRVSLNIETNKCLKVSIKDEGKGFDHQKIFQCITADDIYKSYGRGLILLKSMTEDLFFNEQGNEITLVFQLDAAKPQE